MMNTNQQTTAIATFHFVSTGSNEKQRRCSETKLRELQAKAKMIERKFPSGYQGL